MPSWLWLLSFLPLLARRDGPAQGPPGPPGPPGPNRPAPDDALEVLAGPAAWSLGRGYAPRCAGDLPVVPAVSSGWGTVVREGVEAPLVWAWTAPGQRRAPDLYAGRVVADVELKSWTGKSSEVADAEWLAARCPAVTSHGYVAPALREVLKAFARAGRVGIPQVYDSDRSAEPRGFLRRCVDSYDRAGFSRVLPLLGIVAGVDYTEAWIDECEKMGIPYHLWSTGRLGPKNEPQICAMV